MIQKVQLLRQRSISEVFLHDHDLGVFDASQALAVRYERAPSLQQASRYPRRIGRPEARAAEDELVFYDALEVNDSAVKVLGDETLRTIARELAKTVRSNVTIEWTIKESIQAKLRVMVKRVLRKYGYPPDKQKKATETVLG